MSLAIRAAFACEREALEALQWRASLANEGDRAALLANPDAIHLPLEQIEAECVFIALVAGAAAGFAAIVMREDGDVDLDGLFVEPGSWRKGVGRALVGHCVREARARGANALYVIGNPHAGDFYRSCAFMPAGEAETRFGPALLLKRPV